MTNNPKKRINYLAFEGGGGKGAAYVGAIHALEEKGVISFNTPKEQSFEGKRLDPSKTKGIAGTSAGAITACLLAAGYGWEELKMVILSKIAATFFDDPDVGKCPALPLSLSNTLEPIQLRHNVFKMNRGEMRKAEEHPYRLSGKAGLFSKSFGIPPFLQTKFPAKVVKIAIEKVLKKLSEKHLTDLKPGERILIDKLIKYYDGYLDSLFLDMGLFTGEQIRAFIDDFLEAKFKKANMTFSQLYQETRVILRVAGVCLNTAEVVWFDHRWPWGSMAVADGVRISLSIPGVFKPVAIPSPEFRMQKNTINLNESFLFVDGGVLNNLPIHAFDDVKVSPFDRGVTQVESILFKYEKPRRPKEVYPLNEQVLGLRLSNPTDVQPKYFGSFPAMLGGFLNTLMAPSENAQIRSASEANQTIDLDTSGLSTLAFVVEKNDFNPVYSRAFKKTGDWLTEKGYA